METNKGIKILRIVSLTLGILSMLLFLWSRYAKAEEINTIQFPSDVPYEPKWDYSIWKDNKTAQRNIITAVENTLNTMGQGIDEYVIRCKSYDLTNGRLEIEILYNGGKNSGYATYGTRMFKDWLEGNYYQCWIFCAKKTITVTETGELYGTGNEILTTNSLQSLYGANRSSITLKIGDYNQNAIIYSNTELFEVTDSSGTDITAYRTILQSGAVTGDLDIGQVQEALDLAQVVINGGVQATDSIADAKIGTIQGFFQSIAQAIWNNGQNLINNFKSFFSPFFQFWTSLWNHIKDKIDGIKDDFESLLEKVTAIVQILQQYVANDFTAGGIAQVWESNFTNSHINTLLTTGNNIKTALLELGDVEPNDPVITVNIQNNTFFGTTEEYQFNFSWYNNIKTPVLAFITAFWLVGLGIHLFTQIPNMIHGVSGTAHGIQNAMPTETYSHKDIYH